MQENILIFSPDSDTVHIGLPFIDDDCDKNVVLQLSDRLGQQSFIHVNELANCFRNDQDLSQINTDSICTIMQSLFIVSGYDFISFFAGFGKINFFKHFSSVLLFQQVLLRYVFSIKQQMAFLPFCDLLVAFTVRGMHLHSLIDHLVISLKVFRVTIY